MAEKQDYYELLGVAKDASADDIKKAYRKLAKKCIIAVYLFQKRNLTKDTFGGTIITVKKRKETLKNDPSRGNEARR